MGSFLCPPVFCISVCLAVGQLPSIVLRTRKLISWDVCLFLFCVFLQSLLLLEHGCSIFSAVSADMEAVDILSSLFPGSCAPSPAHHPGHPALGGLVTLLRKALFRCLVISGHLFIFRGGACRAVGKLCGLGGVVHWGFSLEGDCSLLGHSKVIAYLKEEGGTLLGLACPIGSSGG